MARSTHSTVRRTTSVRHSARPGVSRRASQPPAGGGFFGLLSKLSDASQRLEQARPRGRRV